MEVLITTGADVNYETMKKNGHEKCVDLLIQAETLEKKALITSDERDDKCREPARDVACVKHPIKRNTPLMRAADKCVEVLIRAEADVNVQSGWWGCTKLMYNEQ